MYTTSRDIRKCIRNRLKVHRLPLKSVQFHHAHATANLFCLYTYILCIRFFSNRVTQIKTYSWDNAQVILVGNKCDMEHERVISYERGKTLADELNIEFFETSAKDNHNVKVGVLT